MTRSPWRRLAPSKSEATRLIKSGGVYVNSRRISDERTRLRLEDAIERRVIVLRKGQRQHHLVRLATGA